MRLWSIHPKYLDSKGLVALWRETLLAQNVILGKTTGYKNHPQLSRFYSCANPEGAIAKYLRGILKEANDRNYSFDETKIRPKFYSTKIMVTSGQIDFEFCHLKTKLKKRNIEKLRELESVTSIEPHPLFEKVAGNIENWEIVKKEDQVHSRIGPI
jgi:hypothetical protein